MSGGRSGRALALIALLWLALAAAAPPPRIVAVGDLHGDFQAWTDIARDAGLIDAAGKWSGGTTTLVQLGDITDRGPDSLKIITSLRQLQREAPRTGGKVVVVLGNHEAMNATGDLRYVTPGEFAAFATPRSAATRDAFYEANQAAIFKEAQAAKPSVSPAAVRSAWMASHPLGWVEHRTAWAPAGDLGRWARTNPAIVKIGPTLFVHGGISAELSKLPIDQVNRLIAGAMAKGDGGPDSILFDPLGPLWYRGLVIRDADAQAAREAAKSPQQKPEEELKTVLATYSAKRLVVGHTPNLKGLVIGLNGQLVRIDTGNSRYYNGQVSWLEISGDKLTAHPVKRSAP